MVLCLLACRPGITPQPFGFGGRQFVRGAFESGCLLGKREINACADDPLIALRGNQHDVKFSAAKVDPAVARSGVFPRFREGCSWLVSGLDWLENLVLFSSHVDLEISEDRVAGLRGLTVEALRSNVLTK